MEELKGLSNKHRQAAFTDMENEFILNSEMVKNFYKIKKKNDKLKVAAMIEEEMRKSGKFSRNAFEISSRLDNMKQQYKQLKKQEEGFFVVNWKYYTKMKDILE